MIDPAAKAAYEALETIGWEDDAASLATALKKLNHGLPAEDEFKLLMSWLGRCCLIHGTDQLQTPPESSRMLNSDNYHSCL